MKGHAHQRRSVVERDEDAVQVLGVVNHLADLVGLRGRLRRSPHDRREHDHSAVLAQIPARAVTDRVDEIVVHAGEAIELLGEAENLAESADGEDVAALRFDHDGDLVRAAESIRVSAVHLDEGVAIGQQIAELRGQADADGEAAHHRGQQHGDQGHRQSPVDEPLAEAMERAHPLRARRRGLAPHPFRKIRTANRTCADRSRADAPPATPISFRVVGYPARRPMNASAQRLGSSW